MTGAYVGLSLLFFAMTGFAVLVRADEGKRVWPACIPLAIWLAPAVFKTWIALVLS